MIKKEKKEKQVLIVMKKIIKLKKIFQIGEIKLNKVNHLIGNLVKVILIHQVLI